MAIFTYDINQFKFCVADLKQARGDFSRGRQHIFINGMSLEEICKERKIAFDQQNFIQEADFLTLLNQRCFIGAKEQLPHWEKFATALLHQGGLLYAFEAALKETMSMSKNDNETYFPKEIKKEVHISFDKQGLTIKENCIFTELRDPLEEKNLIAKEGSYLIKAQLSHYVSLFEENGEPKFWHVIAQPEFKCKNLELQKCLNQRKLSIMEAIKNFITEIISKIFQLEFEPNRSSFFQKPCYQTQISSSQINMQDDSSNMLENRYTKIINHG